MTAASPFCAQPRNEKFFSGRFRWQDDARNRPTSKWLPATRATEFAPALTLSNATPIDRLRLAVLQAVLAEYPASGFVLNPIDWAGIELTKDNEGRYIIAQPVNGGVPRIWGLPVVETQAMAQNNFLTGAFNMAAQIFDRMDIEVLLSTENEDDFIKNMVTIRAEERLALAVYRPEAFVTGTVTASGG